MYYFILLQSISLTLKAENRVYICNPISAGLKTVEIIVMICIRNRRTCLQVTGCTGMIYEKAQEARYLVLIGAVFPFHFLTKTARLCFLCHSFLLFSLIPQIYLCPYNSYCKGKSILISNTIYIYIKFKILLLLVHVATSLVTRLDSCIYFCQIIQSSPYIVFL